MTEKDAEETKFKLPVKRSRGETLRERLPENAYEKILPTRYLLKDEDGNVTEDPEKMFERVARNIAKPDKEYDNYDYEETVQEFHGLLTDLKFIPNSPTLMNAGTELQQLSACFVVHPEDDLNSIFDTIKKAALIFQTGGGVGYPFHLLRPRGDSVKATGGIASGPLTFQEVFDQMCKTIKQGGRRRGAQMAVMMVDHPDILRFIVSKRNEGRLSNFNISVGLTEDFMEAVKNDREYTLTNPRNGEPHEVTEGTARFYNSNEEWHSEAEGSDIGKDENFWRDYADGFENLKEYEIDLKPGETMEIPAKFIWECFVDSAWKNGEPGLFMYDKANEKHSFDVEKHPEHRMEATNPCVTGDSLINTSNGIFRAEDLHLRQRATDVVVDGRLSEDRLQPSSGVFCTGEKEVYSLTTKEGYELRLTEDHKVMTENGWVETNDLEKGDKVHIVNREGCFGTSGTLEEGRTIGWLVGDGQIKNREKRAVLHFYGKDGEISKEFAGYVNNIVREPPGNGNYTVGVQETVRKEGHRKNKVEERVRSARLYEIAEKLGLVENKFQVPRQVFEGSEELARGFLQALFTADGGVQGNTEKGVSVRLSSSERSLLVDVQRLLLNFGIASKIYRREESGMGELPDSKGGTKPYFTGEQYDLAITKDNLLAFKNKIGFMREDKNRELSEKISSYRNGSYSEKFVATVESVESDGLERVYDLTEPNTKSFAANGIVVHNCGEQPLENYEACNLGHINLSLLVEDRGGGRGLKFGRWKERNADEYDFEEELDDAMADFLDEALDMEEFERVAKVATKFLDNVIDMSDFPLESIDEKVQKTRKIGLGLMGFAQMLIQLGMEYGSEESVECARQIQKMITRFSVEESNRLAEERGKFPDWGESKWAHPLEYKEWFRKYSGGMDPEEWKDGLPLRNHNTTTIAPTGTTSMIVGTSGGCEPIYSVAHFKNVGKDIQGEDMLVEFDDYFLRSLKANGVDVEKTKEEAESLMRNNEWEGVDSLSDDVLPPEIKDLFVAAGQVSPEEHVKIQAAFQEYNQSAISKTCNFPYEATRDDVESAFMLAYDMGVKGLTVYRDGSRKDQVMMTQEKSEKGKKKLLEALIEGYGSVEDLLTSEEIRKRLDEGNLNDILAGESRTESIDRKERKPRNRPNIIHGSTQRINTGQGKMYVTVNEDADGIFELFATIGKSGGFTSSLTEAVGRLVSLALRSGIEPEEVIDELKGIRSPKMAWDKGTKIHSIPDGIGKALERYLDGEARRVQESVESFSSEDDEGEKMSENEKKELEEMIERGINPECPKCGSILEYTEGCVKCTSCGYSEC